MAKLTDKQNKGGRPTKFKEEYCEQARKLCLLGSTDVQLADFFEVSESTIHQWKLDYPQFSESLRSGKVVADAEVANSLYKKATGYEVTEDKILSNSQNPHDPVIVQYQKHFSPDTGAAFIWLKNRRSDQWRDKKETEVSGDSLVDAMVALAEGLPD